MAVPRAFSKGITEAKCWVTLEPACHGQCPLGPDMGLRAHRQFLGEEWGDLGLCWVEAGW